MVVDYADSMSALSLTTGKCVGVHCTVYFILEKIDENCFIHYLVIGWSESHISLTFQ